MSYINFKDYAKVPTTDIVSDNQITFNRKNIPYTMNHEYIAEEGKDINLILSNKTENKKLYSINRQKIYGISYDLSTKTGTRLYDAKDMIWQRSTTTVKGIDDFFDKASIYKHRECLVVYTPPNDKDNMDEQGRFNGKYEIIYKDELSKEEWNKTLNEYPNGNVCIEFPKFYFKRLGEVSWAVSNEPLPNFKLSPMHYRDGILYDKCYVYKYMANSSFLSRSGQSIYTNIPITTFRAGFKEKGFYNLDYACWASIAMLAFIKYASIDSQLSVGYGYTHSSHTTSANTGRGDEIQGLDGGTNASVTDQNQCIVCLGLEDLWGNIWEMVDGLCCYNTQVYYSNSLIQDYPTNAMDLKVYKSVDTPCASSVNSDNNYPYAYIRSLMNDAEFSELIIPATSTAAVYSYGGDTGSQPIPDGYFYRTNQWSCLMLGGGWNNGSACGLLYSDLSSVMSYTSRAYGARAFTVIS